MTRTVDELRNDVRAATGRFEREIAAAFTKEDLAALCETVGYEIDTASLPSKPQMRAGVLFTIGVLDDDDPDETGRPFRKDELVAIADALDA